MYWLGLAKPDTDYFGGQDLPNLQAKITVTIKNYSIENIRTQSGTTKKGVLHFSEDVKPWIVNKTKLKPIVNKYGFETDNWIGKKITLYFDPLVKFGKDVTGGVRCEMPRETPLPKCEECGGNIEAAGKMTPEQTAEYIKAKYGKYLCGKCATAKAQQQQGAE